MGDGNTLAAWLFREAGGMQEPIVAAFWIGSELLWDQCTWLHAMAPGEPFSSIVGTTGRILGLLADVVRLPSTAPRDD